MTNEPKDDCYLCGAPEDYDNPLSRDYAGVAVCARGCVSKPESEEE